MRYFDTYKGLPHSIYILFLAQVINRFGDFVLPFLTLLLVKKMGLSFQTAGLAVMCATLSTIPGAFAGGKIADHFGRKKTYGLFQASAGMAILTCAFVTSPYMVIGLVCISAFFNGGVRPCLTAIISDVLPPEKRQLGFSLSYLGINLGVALGPMVAGFLFNHNFKWIFIGDAITSVLAVTLMLTQIKETMPEQVEETNKDASVPILEQAETGTVFDVLFRRPHIMLFLLINTVISMTYVQHSFSLPMMSDFVFGAKGAQYFGYIMSFNAITVLAMTTVITHHTQKFHPLTNICMAALTYALGFGMIGWITSFPLFILSTFLWTVGEILVVTNFSVYISNNTPQNFRARFNAVTSLSWACGSALGTFGMGRYMDAMGVKAVWPLTFALGCVAAGCIYVLRHFELKRNQMMEKSQFSE